MSRVRIPAAQAQLPLEVPDDDSEDEFAAWKIDESPSPSAHTSPKRPSTPRRPTTPIRFATPRRVRTPASRRRVPPSPEVIDLTATPPSSSAGTQNHSDDDNEPLSTSTPRTRTSRAKTPSRKLLAPSLPGPSEPVASNLQLQTPPISSRSSSSINEDAIPVVPDADPYDEAAALFREDTPQPLTRPRTPVTPKAAKKDHQPVHSDPPGESKPLGPATRTRAR